MDDPINSIIEISHGMERYAKSQMRKHNSKVYENAIVIANAIENKQLDKNELCASMRGLAITAKHQSPYISASLDFMADQLSKQP